MDHHGFYPDINSSFSSILNSSTSNNIGNNANNYPDNNNLTGTQATTTVNNLKYQHQTNLTPNLAQTQININNCNNNLFFPTTDDGIFDSGPSASATSSVTNESSNNNHSGNSNNQKNIINYVRKLEPGNTTGGDNITYNINNINTNIVNNINNPTNIANGTTDFFNTNQYPVNKNPEAIINFTNTNINSSSSMSSNSNPANSASTYYYQGTSQLNTFDSTQQSQTSQPSQSQQQTYLDPNIGKNMGGSGTAYHSHHQNPTNLSNQNSSFLSNNHTNLGTDIASNFDYSDPSANKIINNFESKNPLKFATQNGSRLAPSYYTSAQQFAPLPHPHLQHGVNYHGAPVNSTIVPPTVVNKVNPNYEAYSMSRNVLPPHPSTHYSSHPYHQLNENLTMNSCSRINYAGTGVQPFPSSIHPSSHAPYMYPPNGYPNSNLPIHPTNYHRSLSHQTASSTGYPNLIKGYSRSSSHGPLPTVPPDTSNYPLQPSTYSNQKPTDTYYPDPNSSYPYNHFDETLYSSCAKVPNPSPTSRSKPAINEMYPNNMYSDSHAMSYHHNMRNMSYNQGLPKALNPGLAYGPNALGTYEHSPYHNLNSCSVIKTNEFATKNKIVPYISPTKINPVNSTKQFKTYSNFEQTPANSKQSDKVKYGVDLEEQITGSRILKVRDSNFNYGAPNHYDFNAAKYHPYYSRGHHHHHHHHAVENKSNTGNLREFLSSWNEIDEDEDVDKSQNHHQPSHINIGALNDNAMMANERSISREYNPMFGQRPQESSVIITGNVLLNGGNLPDIVVDIEKQKLDDSCLSSDLSNSEKLYVLESYEVPASEINKYKHLSVINKLPENIVPIGVESSLKFIEEIELNREKYYKNDLDTEVLFDAQDDDQKLNEPFREKDSKDNDSEKVKSEKTNVKSNIPKDKNYNNIPVKKTILKKRQKINLEKSLPIKKKAIKMKIEKIPKDHRKLRITKKYRKYAYNTRPTNMPKTLKAISIDFINTSNYRNYARKCLSIKQNSCKKEFLKDIKKRFNFDSARKPVIHLNNKANCSIKINSLKEICNRAIAENENENVDPYYDDDNFQSYSEYPDFENGEESSGNEEENLEEKEKPTPEEKIEEVKKEEIPEEKTSISLEKNPLSPLDSNKQETTIEPPKEIPQKIQEKSPQNSSNRSSSSSDDSSSSSDSSSDDSSSDSSDSSSSSSSEDEDDSSEHSSVSKIETKKFQEQTQNVVKQIESVQEKPQVTPEENKEVILEKQKETNFQEMQKLNQELCREFKENEKIILQEPSKEIVKENSQEIPQPIKEEPEITEAPSSELEDQKMKELEEEIPQEVQEIIPQEVQESIPQICSSEVPQEPLAFLEVPRLKELCKQKLEEMDYNIIENEFVTNPLSLKEICENFVYSNRQYFIIEEVSNIPKLQDLCKNVLSETSIFINLDEGNNFCIINEDGSENFIDASEFVGDDPSEPMYLLEENSETIAELFSSTEHLDILDKLQSAEMLKKIQQAASMDVEDEIFKAIDEMHRDTNLCFNNNSNIVSNRNICTDTDPITSVMSFIPDDINIQYEEVVPVNDIIYRNEKIYQNLRFKYLNRINFKFDFIFVKRILKKYLYYQRYFQHNDKYLLKKNLKFIQRKPKKLLKNNLTKNCDKILELINSENNLIRRIDCSSYESCVNTNNHLTTTDNESHTIAKDDNEDDYSDSDDESQYTQETNQSADSSSDEESESNYSDSSDESSRSSYDSTSPESPVEKSQKESPQSPEEEKIDEDIIQDNSNTSSEFRSISESAFEDSSEGEKSEVSKIERNSQENEEVKVLETVKDFLKITKSQVSESTIKNLEVSETVKSSSKTSEIVQSSNNFTEELIKPVKIFKNLKNEDSVLSKILEEPKKPEKAEEKSDIVKTSHIAENSTKLEKKSEKLNVSESSKNLEEFKETTKTSEKLETKKELDHKKAVKSTQITEEPIKVVKDDSKSSQITEELIKPVKEKINGSKTSQINKDLIKPIKAIEKTKTPESPFTKTEKLEVFESFEALIKPVKFDEKPKIKEPTNSSKRLRETVRNENNKKLTTEKFEAPPQPSNDLPKKIQENGSEEKIEKKNHLDNSHRDSKKLESPKKTLKSHLEIPVKSTKELELKEIEVKKKSSKEETKAQLKPLKIRLELQETPEIEFVGIKTQEKSTTESQKQLPREETDLQEKNDKRKLSNDENHSKVFKTNIELSEKINETPSRSEVDFQKKPSKEEAIQDNSPVQPSTPTALRTRSKTRWGSAKQSDVVVIPKDPLLEKKLEAAKIMIEKVLETKAKSTEIRHNQKDSRYRKDRDFYLRNRRDRDYRHMDSGVKTKEHHARTQESRQKLRETQQKIQNLHLHEDSKDPQRRVDSRSRSSDSGKNRDSREYRSKRYDDKERRSREHDTRKRSSRDDREREGFSSRVPRRRDSVLKTPSNHSRNHREFNHDRKDNRQRHYRDSHQSRDPPLPIRKNYIAQPKMPLVPIIFPVVPAKTPEIQPITIPLLIPEPVKVPTDAELQIKETEQKIWEIELKMKETQQKIKELQQIQQEEIEMKMYQEEVRKRQTETEQQHKLQANFVNNNNCSKEELEQPQIIIDVDELEPVNGLVEQNGNATVAENSGDSVDYAMQKIVSLNEDSNNNIQNNQNNNNINNNCNNFRRNMKILPGRIRKRKLSFDESLLSIEKFYNKITNNIENNIINVNPVEICTEVRLQKPVKKSTLRQRSKSQHHRNGHDSRSNSPPSDENSHRIMMNQSFHKRDGARRLIIPSYKIYDKNLDIKLKIMPYVKIQRSQQLEKLVKLNNFKDVGQ